MTSRIGKKRLFPLTAVPFRIIIVMRNLIGTDTHHSHHRIPLLVGSYLPHPITLRRAIHQRMRTAGRIIRTLIHPKRTVRNGRENITFHIFQLQRTDIYIIEVQEVRILIIRMPSSIRKINLILPVRQIFGIRARAGRLHHLVRPPYDSNIVFLVG